MGYSSLSDMIQAGISKIQQMITVIFFFAQCFNRNRLPPLKAILVLYILILVY